MGPGRRDLVQSGGHRGGEKWHLGCVWKVGAIVLCAECAMGAMGKERSRDNSGVSGHATGRPVRLFSVMGVSGGRADPGTEAVLCLGCAGSGRFRGR